MGFWTRGNEAQLVRSCVFPLLLCISQVLQRNHTNGREGERNFFEGIAHSIMGTESLEWVGCKQTRFYAVTLRPNFFWKFPLCF